MRNKKLIGLLILVAFVVISGTACTKALDYSRNNPLEAQIDDVTNAADATDATDAIVPVITITAPTTASTYSTSLTTVDLGGTASDDIAVASVTWTNAATTASGTASGASSWSVPGVNLGSGANAITVTARDAAGNKATAAIVITKTGDAPSIAITQPTAAATYSATNATMSIGGTASDDVGVTSVSWANAATSAWGTASGTSFWTISNIVLNAGDNAITVTAWDAKGDSATDTITVTRILDAIAPVVTITTPTSAVTYSTTGTTIDLGGSASDNWGVASIAWTNAATASKGVASGTILWSVSAIPLNMGANAITITVKDAAFNSSTDIITVTRTYDYSKDPMIVALEANMVAISGGTWNMGNASAGTSYYNYNNGSVTVSSFYACKYELKNKEYKVFCDATSRAYPPAYPAVPGYFTAYPDHPAVNVSWNDAKAFCDWMALITGKNYRMPTEAEWEYAADTTKPNHNDYPWGNIWNTARCNNVNYSGSITRVGSIWQCGSTDIAVTANSYGLYDMSGNVWEWGSDWWGGYDGTAYPNQTNPTGPANGTYKVMRGGSSGCYEYDLRCVSRSGLLGPDSKASGVGFRLFRQ